MSWIILKIKGTLFVYNEFWHVPNACGTCDSNYSSFEHIDISSRICILEMEI